MPLEITLQSPPGPVREVSFVEACLAHAKAKKSVWNPFHYSTHDLTPTAGPMDDSRWAFDEAQWTGMDDAHLQAEFLVVV